MLLIPHFVVELNWGFSVTRIKCTRQLFMHFFLHLCMKEAVCLTRVMMPNSCAAEPDVILGVDRPLTGGEELARERAVTEVGMEERGRRVTLSPSMLPLFTRLSSSSARSSAFSRSTWIILREGESNNEICIAY